MNEIFRRNSLVLLRRLDKPAMQPVDDRNQGSWQTTSDVTGRNGMEGGNAVLELANCSQKLWYINENNNDSQLEIIGVKLDVALLATMMTMMVALAFWTPLSCNQPASPIEKGNIMMQTGLAHSLTRSIARSLVVRSFPLCVFQKHKFIAKLIIYEIWFPSWLLLHFSFVLFRAGFAGWLHIRYLGQLIAFDLTKLARLPSSARLSRFTLRSGLFGMESDHDHNLSTTRKIDVPWSKIFFRFFD